jgi:hypothetical protein
MIGRVRALISVAFVAIVGCGSEPRSAQPLADVGEGVISDVTDAAAEVRVDTGPTPLGGEWIAFPAPECAKEVAVDAEKAIPALQWVPCASGGCEELVTDWTTTDPDPLQLYGREHARLVKGAPHLYYTRRYPDAVDVDVVQPLGGPARFAMRGPRTGKCSLDVAFGELGIALTPRALAPLASGAEILITTQRWDGPLTVHRFAPELLGSPVNIYGAAISGSGAFIERITKSSSYYVGKLQFLDVAGKTLSTVAPSLLKPKAFGAGVVAVSGPTWFGEDDAVEQLVDYVPNHSALDFAIDRTGSGTLVWIDGEAPPSGGAFTRFALWASPFATKKADLRPRKLTMLPGPHYRDAVANGGVVVVRGATPDSALIVRISDGMNWTVSVGRESLIPLWVDETHAYLIVASDDVVDRATGTIVRVTRAGLGEPRPATP